MDYEKFIMYSIQKNKLIKTFADIEIKKRKFHYSKYAINITKGDIDKIILSNRVSLGKKGFKHIVGHRGDVFIKLL